MLLYVSDVHIASVADARHMQALMDQLETFNADILLLGGDYSDVRLWDQLRCFGNTDKKSALKRTAYAQSHLWMASLADFDAPLGKFAVQGNHDCTDASLMESLAQGGVQLLMNEAAIIEKNGAQLAIAGVGDYENDLPLLTHADIGAAPENAIDSIKKIAKVFLKSADQCAIKELIERLEKRIEK